MKSEEVSVVTAKVPRTKAELEAMILDRIHRNPDWNIIRDVVVTPTSRFAPHTPNWDAAFIVDGAALRPADAQHLITALQNDYDLVGE
jgi:hypothetical protein